jgi:hypothetical protein
MKDWKTDMPKYKTNFERDWAFYVDNSSVFTFSGKPLITHPFKATGVSAKEAFYIKDSTGKVIATKELTLLQKVFNVKASINLQIKMWAEDLAMGILHIQDLWYIKKEYNPPDWVFDAIVQQSKKYATNKKMEVPWWLDKYLPLLKSPLL